MSSNSFYEHNTDSVAEQLDEAIARQVKIQKDIQVQTYPVHTPNRIKYLPDVPEYTSLPPNYNDVLSPVGFIVIITLCAVISIIISSCLIKWAVTDDDPNDD